MPKAKQKLSTKPFLLSIRKALRFIPILGFILSCAQHEKTNRPDQIAVEEIDNQVIQFNALLTKIYEGKIKPLSCIEDKEEAELLLRALASRFDSVTDVYQSRLDHQDEIQDLINNCESNCTCDYVEELFKENEIELSTPQSAQFNQIKAKMVSKNCTDQIQKIFCQSQLFRELDKEKDHFKYEE